MMGVMGTMGTMGTMGVDWSLNSARRGLVKLGGFSSVSTVRG